MEPVEPSPSQIPAPSQPYETLNVKHDTSVAFDFPSLFSLLTIIPSGTTACRTTPTRYAREQGWKTLVIMTQDTAT